MARGRKPDLPGMQEAKGNPGKRKRQPAEPQQTEQPQQAPALIAPKQLKAAALTLWKAIEPDARRMNFVRVTDVAGLARYCHTLARYWEAETALGPFGKGKSIQKVATVAGGHMLRHNPWVSIRDRLAMQLMALEDRLGFNPQARQQYLRGLASAPPELPFGKMPQPGQTAPQPGAAPAAEADGGPIGFLNSGAVH